MGRPKGGPKLGGRKPGVPNKNTAEIKAICHAYGPEVIEILMDIARNSPNDAARIAAGDKVLDRGYGKPKQGFEFENKDEAITVNINRLTEPPCEK